MQDDYEGNYSTRRSLLYALNLLKTYLYLLVILQSIQRSYQKFGWICSRRFFYSNQRPYLHSCSKSNTKLYRQCCHKFGARYRSTTNIIQVTDATNIAENVYININNESIYVDRKEGNTLFTKRGQDGTITGSHVRGTAVNVITDADDALIEVGDDFGFDGALS